MYKVYEKNNLAVYTYKKFIYYSSVYKIWKHGAYLIEEKYYASDKPIILKKKNIFLKKSNYLLYRCFELYFAPENYLIKNNFKKL